MLSAYLAGTDIPDEQYNRIYEILPEFRRRAADAKKSAEAKRETVLAFYLLMYALKKNGYISEYSEFENLKYSEGEHGKPYFGARPDICFSLSHTKGMVLCVLSDEIVGCDIEGKNKDREGALRIADRFFTKEEANRIRLLDERHAVDEFYRIWTMKESFVKRNGNGLTQPLDSFSVFDCSPRPAVLFEDDAYAAGICCTGIDCSLERIEKGWPID